MCLFNHAIWQYLRCPIDEGQNMKMMLLLKTCSDVKNELLTALFIPSRVELSEVRLFYYEQDWEVAIIISTRWDPQARQWSFVASMATPRSTVGVAVLNGK